MASTKRPVALFLTLAVSLGGVVAIDSPADAAVATARCSTTGSVKDAKKPGDDLTFYITSICIPSERSRAVSIVVRGNIWLGRTYSDLGRPLYRQDFRDADPLLFSNPQRSLIKKTVDCVPGIYAIRGSHTSYFTQNRMYESPVNKRIIMPPTKVGCDG